MSFVWVTSKELGNCPSAVYMDSGLKERNIDVWGNYTPFEQKFIDEHENGHFLLKTDSEELADKYALYKMFREEPQSLKKSIGTLAKVGVSRERINKLYTEALLLDSQHGNTGAKEELKRLKKNYMKPKKNIPDFLSVLNRVRVDGSTYDETYIDPVITDDVIKTKNNPLSGIVDLNISGDGFILMKKFYISFETLLLFILLVVFLKK